MYGNETSSLIAGRKRGSLKCGLRSKVNVPKGNAAPKPPLKVKISNEQKNELEQVFAALKKSSVLSNSVDKPSKGHAECDTTGGVERNNNLIEKTSNTIVTNSQRTGGNVSKLLQKLESQPKFSCPFQTLPAKPTKLKPVAAPRKTKTLQSDSEKCVEQVPSIQQQKGDTCAVHDENTASVAGCSVSERDKPQAASKPFPTLPKPSTLPKPRLPAKPKDQNKCLNAGCKTGKNLSDAGVNKTSSEHPNLEDNEKVKSKDSISRKRFNKAPPPPSFNKAPKPPSYSKAPPPPSRPNRSKLTPPSTFATREKFDLGLPVLDMCVTVTHQDTCPMNVSSMVAGNEKNLSVTAQDSEWSDVSDGEKLSQETHSSVQCANSRSRKGSHKTHSSKRKRTRGSSKSATSYTDVTTAKKASSDSEWETDDETRMVDSQGYEDVERLCAIALQVSRSFQNQPAIPQEAPTDDSQSYSEAIPYHGKSELIESTSGDEDYPSVQMQPSGEGYCTYPRKRSVKQKRTSIRKSESPKLPPKNMLKLSPKTLKSQLSREVPVPVADNYTNSGPPKTLPRQKSSLSESSSGDKPPEVPRRRTKTDLGFSNNAELSRVLGLSRETKSVRDSSGYLIPMDMPEGDDTPPPPLPPRGLQKSASQLTTSRSDWDREPRRGPVKSRSDTMLEEKGHEEMPPLLPRKTSDRKLSAPSTRAFKAPLPPPLLEEAGLESRPYSGISIVIPPARDSLFEGGASPSVHYVDPNPPVPNSNIKYLPMDQKRPADMDVPPPVAPRNRENLHLAVPPPHSWRTSESDESPSQSHSYLKLLEEGEEYPGTPVTPELDPSLFAAEPLYQIYHCGAVLRDVMENEIEDINENEKIYDDAETVRSYVTSILSRVGSEYGTDVKLAPSSLESAVHGSQGTAGMRTLWAEMKQVQESGLLDTMEPNDKKLQEALFEILTSEASYVKSLDLLVTHFMGAPAIDVCNTRACVLSKRDYQVLFSNLHRVRSVSKRFLMALEKIWKSNCLLDPVEICELVREFTQKHFEVYVTYCSNQIYQDRKLQELKKTNSEFSEAVSRIESAQVCQGLTLQSFLTLPMQRITRLPLLVDAVCHRMDSTRDSYEQATQCLHTLQKLVKQCNEGARRMGNLEQVAEIDRMLEFKNVKKVPVVSQSRSLVKKGALSRILSTASSGLLDKLKKKKETLHLFLFNDLMLITKKKSEDLYHVIDHDARINIHADLIPTSKAATYPTSNKNLFKMVLLEMKSEYIFAAESESERMRWVEAVTPAQQQSDHEKIYETWDCPQVQAVHQYTAQQPDELSLEESDVINVYRKMADGWYEGERIRDGETGWFPSTHVVEIQSQHVRARNLRQHYRMLQMSLDEMSNSKAVQERK